MAEMTDVASDRRKTNDAAPAEHDGTPALTRLLLFVFALTCGLSVANVYYAQPLLGSIAETFSIDPATIGLVVTLTQVGYAIGLLALVPLGDLVDRRKLIVAQTALCATALVVVGTAPHATILFTGLIAMGLLAVVVQVVVAFTANLATASERGSAVGFVTSGVVIGILGARFVSGVIADLGGWRWVYLTSAALMLAISALLAWLLPRKAAKLASDESYLQVLRSVPTLFLRDKLLRTRAILALLIFASFSTLWTAMVLPLSAAPFHFSHTQIGLFGLAGVAGALAASGAGRLADRGFERWTSGLALALLTGSWMAIGALHASLIAFTLGIIGLDLAVQAVHVTNQSLIFAARPEAQSRLVGGYMIFYSVGSGIGAISATGIYALAGWLGVAVLGATFSGAGLLFWWLSPSSPVDRS